VRNREEALKIASKLREINSIDVRDFIMGDSDIDVLSDRVRIGPELAQRYGVHKIDSISREILDHHTSKGFNEVHQGHIPAEKVRVGKQGVRSHPALGDGVREIFDGRLSVHFEPAELFRQTHYAKQQLNHPILLATRYLRLQAMNYFYTHGRGVPDLKMLEAGMDSASRKAVHEVIDRALNGRELKPYFEKAQFVKWLNGNIQKAFRSYTNPSAALALMKEFKVDQLVANHEGLDSIYNYVFAKHRDPQAIRGAHQLYRVNETKFYQPVERFFPDRILYHGSRREEDFRSILFQGILPSEGGSAGKGLYGVALPDRSFAESWGGDPKRLVSLEIRPDARIVDVTQGEGERVFKAFQRETGQGLEEFAEALDVDLIRYPYTPQAFVVKNSQALGAAKGVHRQLLSFSQAMQAVEQVRTLEDLRTVSELLSVNRFNSEEQRYLTEPLLEKGAKNLFSHLELDRDTGVLADVFYGQGAIKKLLREHFAGQALREMSSQVRDLRGMIRWLNLGISIRSEPVVERFYGSFNVSVPSVTRARARENAPLKPDLREVEDWLRMLGNSKRFLQTSARPENAEELKMWLLLLDRSRAWNGFEAMRAKLKQGISEYDTGITRPQAEKRALDSLGKSLFFEESEEVMSRLVEMTAASSLPEAERRHLIERLLDFWEKPEIGLRKLAEGDWGELGAHGAFDTLPPLQEFLASQAVEDYLRFAFLPFSGLNDIEKRAYVAVYSQAGWIQILKVMEKMREDLVNRSSGALLSRILQSPELTELDWSQIASEPGTYVHHNNKTILQMLVEKYHSPSVTKLPPQAIEAISQIPSHRVEHFRPEMRDFFVREILKDEAFYQQPEAIELFAHFLQYNGAGLMEPGTMQNDSWKKVLKVAMPQLLTRLNEHQLKSAMVRSQLIEALIQYGNDQVDENLMKLLEVPPYSSHPFLPRWRRALAVERRERQELLQERPTGWQRRIWDWGEGKSTGTCASYFAPILKFFR
jgi:hypothetical protein